MNQIDKYLTGETKTTIKNYPNYGKFKTTVKIYKKNGKERKLIYQEKLSDPPEQKATIYKKFDPKDFHFVQTKVWFNRKPGKEKFAWVNVGYRR